MARLMHNAGAKGLSEVVLPGHDKTRRCTGEQSSRPELYGKDAERALGSRHHVNLDRPGLVVSGGSDGSLLETHHRLVDESAH